MGSKSEKPGPIRRETVGYIKDGLLPRTVMDFTAQEFVRIAVGLVILAYVGYCLLNQKVWLRGPIALTSKIFAWGSREENQSIFLIHVITGTVIGIWMTAGPFLI